MKRIKRIHIKVSANQGPDTRSSENVSYGRGHHFVGSNGGRQPGPVVISDALGCQGHRLKAVTFPSQRRSALHAVAASGE